MKLYICSFAIIILSITNTLAQTPLPYFTAFDNSSQQAGWQEFRKGDKTNSDWSYASFKYFSAPNTLGHYYPVGGTLPTDDWFVSPEFDFSKGGKIDSVRHNFSGFGTPFAGDTISIFLLNGSADPDLATSKTLLFDYTLHYVNDNIWHLDTNMIIPAKPGKSYIAIKYTTTINWLDVFFDNIKISGNTSTDVNQEITTDNDFRIFPNPVKDILNISKPVSANTAITITDVNGKVVQSLSAAQLNQERQIDVAGMDPGIYFLNVTLNHISKVKMILKQ